MTIPAWLLGLLRGLGFALITAALSYLGHAENLTYLSPTVATVVAMVVLAIEHSIESSTGKALFGAVKA